jgi:hypothetical protein
MYFYDLMIKLRISNAYNSMIYKEYYDLHLFLEK